MVSGMISDEMHAPQLLRIGVIDLYALYMDRTCAFPYANHTKMYTGAPIVVVDDEIRSRKCFPGLDVMIMLELCGILTNVSCEFHYFSHRKFGSVDENGIANGLVGDIQAGRIDCAIMGNSPSREHAITMTVPVEKPTLFAVTRFPEESDDLNIHSIIVFSQGAAIGLFVMTLMVILVMIIFRCCNRRENTADNLPKTAHKINLKINQKVFGSCGNFRMRPSSFYSREVTDVALELCLNLVQQSLNLKPQQEKGTPAVAAAENVLQLIWRLSILFIVAAYSSGILASLVVKTFTLPFHNQRTLARCFRRGRCVEFHTYPTSRTFGMIRDPKTFSQLARAFRHHVPPERAVFQRSFDRRRLVEKRRGNFIVRFTNAYFAAQRLSRDIKAGYPCRHLTMDMNNLPMYRSIAFRRLLPPQNRPEISVHNDERKVANKTQQQFLTTSNEAGMIFRLNRIINRLHQTGVLLSLTSRKIAPYYNNNQAQAGSGSGSDSCKNPKPKEQPLKLTVYFGLSVPIGALLFGAFLVLLMEIINHSKSAAARSSPPKKGSKRGGNGLTQTITTKISCSIRRWSYSEVGGSERQEQAKSIMMNTGVVVQRMDLGELHDLQRFIREEIDRRRMIRSKQQADVH